MKTLITISIVLTTSIPTLISMADDLCPLTTSDVTWSPNCFYKTNVRRVRPKYLRNIIADESGSTTVMISGLQELVAINAQGMVTISNIFYTGDYDYPNASSGIARYSDGQKCGYFDQKALKIKIPAIYDNCMPFHDGKALVCNGCTSYCTEQECQNRVFIGGETIVLSAKNKIIEKYKSATLDTFCTPPAALKIKQYGNSQYLKCENLSSQFHVK